MKEISNHILSRSISRILGPNDKGVFKPLICIQGGGARGGWQAGVLKSLLENKNISPVAFYGSSAGAINSYLAANTINNGDNDILSEYWLKPSKLTALLLFISTIINSLLISLPLSITSIICKHSRFPGLIPFWVFKYIVTKNLPENNESDVNIYIYSTDINCPNPPTYNSQNPFTFHIQKHSNTALLKNKMAISVKTAIALSCCLPFVNSSKIDTARFADGGIYSNLPIDIVYTQGAMGGNSIIVLLSKPIRNLDPHKDEIDYKSLLMLHEIKQNQQKAILKVIEESKNDINVHSGPSYMYSLILIVEPEIELSAGRTKGFFLKKYIRRDYEQGLNLGTKLSELTNHFLNNDSVALKPYLLSDIELPPLPSKRPGFSSFWVNWVNKNWKYPNNTA